VPWGLAGAAGLGLVLLASRGLRGRHRPVLMRWLLRPLLATLGTLGLAACAFALVNFPWIVEKPGTFACRTCWELEFRRSFGPREEVEPVAEESRLFGLGEPVRTLFAR